MTKTEKLILLLCLECVRSADFSFQKVTTGTILVNMWDGDEIVKYWYIFPQHEKSNANLTKAIKEIRAINRGKK